MDIVLVTQVPWASPLDEGTEIIGPGASDGAFVTPGPRRIPRRRSLQLGAGPGGVAAVVLSPSGEGGALAVSPDGALVALPAPSLGVVPRSDGTLWTLSRSGLHHVDAAGATLGSVAETAVRLLATPDDGAWLVGNDAARRVDAAGGVTGPWPWASPLASAVLGQRLCRIEKDGRTVSCLDADGTRTDAPMPSTAGPFERLLTATIDGLRPAPATRTAEVAGLSQRFHDGRVVQWVLSGVGRTADGAPFVALRASDGLTIHVGGSAPRTIRIDPAAPWTPRASAVAVQGDRVLLTEGAHAGWTSPEGAEANFDLDEAVYAQQIFPIAWSGPGPYPFTVGPDDRLYLAATGPDGVAVIALGGAR